MTPATGIVLIIVAAVFLAVIVNEIRKKKQGKSSCSCGCSGCPMNDTCHKDK